MATPNTLWTDDGTTITTPTGLTFTAEAAAFIRELGTHLDAAQQQVASLTTQVSDLQAQIAATVPPAPVPAPTPAPMPESTPAPNPTSAPQDLAALTARVDGIQTKLDAHIAEPPPVDLTARVATLEAQIAQLVQQLATEPATIIGRVAADLTAAEGTH